MTPAHLESPELINALLKEQEAIDRLKAEQDNHRITIPAGVIDLITKTARPSDLALINAWNGRVCPPADYTSKDALLAVAMLPTLEQEPREWWHLQLPKEPNSQTIHYHQFLPSHTVRPNQTFDTARRIIAETLAPTIGDIPTPHALAVINHGSIHNTIRDYQFLRHICFTLVNIDPGAPPEPELLAQDLSDEGITPDIDIGTLHRNPSMPPPWGDLSVHICRTCDTWVADHIVNEFDRHQLQCPYCKPPFIQIRPPSPNPTDAVHSFARAYAPTPYQDSTKPSYRIAALTGATPAQVANTMAGKSADTALPMQCPQRRNCPSRCAAQHFPPTEHGNFNECPILPTISQIQRLNPEQRDDYVTDQAERIQTARRAQSKWRDDHEPAPETPAPSGLTQPTLF